MLPALNPRKQESLPHVLLRRSCQHNSLSALPVPCQHKWEWMQVRTVIGIVVILKRLFSCRRRAILRTYKLLFDTEKPFPYRSSPTEAQMQMNPQAFSSYNPGHFHFMPAVSAPGFALSEIDPSSNPSLSHHGQVVRVVILTRNKD